MIEVVNGFERRLYMLPAWDRRQAVPSNGTHGVEMRFVLIGLVGAVQFVLFTNWQLPEVTDEWLKELEESDGGILSRPMPAELSYHAAQPRYPDQEASRCDYLTTGKCYSDGSVLNAEPVFERLLREGEAGVWDALEQYYAVTFSDELRTAIRIARAHP